MLLDGQPWPPGESIVANLTPLATSDVVSARLFALLIPTYSAKKRLGLRFADQSAKAGPGAVRCRSCDGRLQDLSAHQLADMCRGSVVGSQVPGAAAI